MRDRCFLYTSESCKIKGDVDCLTDKEMQELHDYQAKQLLSKQENEDWKK